MSWKSEVQVGRDPWCSNALRLVTPFVVKKAHEGRIQTVVGQRMPGAGLS
jgi:hypothetical protein